MTGPEHDKNLILRVKDDSDGVIPSPGSVAIRNLLRLFRITGRVNFAQAAEKTVEAILSGDTFHPASFPHMLAALCHMEARGIREYRKIRSRENEERETKIQL